MKPTIDADTIHFSMKSPKGAEWTRDALSVAVLVGSLRGGSFSRKIAQAAISLASDSLAMEIVEIGELPPYNEDLEDAPATPPLWLSFRDRIRRVDGVLFVTPEYNRSVPAVLKNALDLGSRPRVESVGAINRARSSTCRSAPSELSGRTIICANRSCSLTCLRCSSQRRTSETPRRCSIARAA